MFSSVQFSSVQFSSVQFAEKPFKTLKRFLGVLALTLGVSLVFGCKETIQENTTSIIDEETVPQGKCAVCVNPAYAVRAAYPLTISQKTAFGAVISYTSTQNNKTMYLGSSAVVEKPEIIKGLFDNSSLRFVFAQPTENAEYTLNLYAFSALTDETTIDSACAKGTATKTMALEPGQKVYSEALSVELAYLYVNGKGFVNLPISFDSSYKIKAGTVDVEKQNDDGTFTACTNPTGFSIQITAAATDGENSTGGFLIGDNISFGNYRVTMHFYTDVTDDGTADKTSLFYTLDTVQTVQVFTGLETNCWYQNGTKVGTTSDNGTFTPGALKIEATPFTELYVLGSDTAFWTSEGNSTAGAASFNKSACSATEDDNAQYGFQGTIGTTTSENDGKRTFYTKERFGDSIPSASTNNKYGSLNAPFATLQQAADFLAKYAIKDGNYTIYVDGTLTATSSSDITSSTFVYFNTSVSCTVTIKPCVSTSKAVINAGAYLDSNGTAQNKFGGVIFVASGVNLTFENLIITGGYAMGEMAKGGGIHSEGNITVKNCIIAGNMIPDTNATGGGGIYAAGVLTMSNSAVIGNNANGGGGGIYISKEADISNSVIINNTASSSDSGLGGGIYTSVNSITIKNSDVTDNSAGLSGGGIYINATLLSNGNAEFERVSFLSNSALESAGGIYISYHKANQAKITSCKISANSISKTNGCGGGIFYWAENTYNALILVDTSITSNSATGNGSKGGGLHLSEKAKGIMSSGKISGNSLGSGGVGVGVWYSKTASFTQNSENYPTISDSDTIVKGS